MADLSRLLDLDAHAQVKGLTNVLKHAGPAHATVTVHYGAREVAIEVADDTAARSAGMVKEAIV